MIKRKPYILFLFASSLLFLIGLLKSDETFDINVHDTYFVIAQNHLYWLFSLLLFFFFMIYFALEKIKFNWLKNLELIHVYGTLLFSVGMFFPYELVFKSPDFQLFDDYQRSNTYRSFFAVFFLIAQFLLIINIFVTIIKRLRTLVTQ
jgi:cytochrome c oxidase subunit 1